MEPFHYFAGFSTFICTLAIAHVLKGFSDLVEARSRVRWDWIQTSRRYLAFYVFAAWLLVILLPLLTRTLGALN